MAGHRAWGDAQPLALPSLPVPITWLVTAPPLWSWVFVGADKVAGHRSLQGPGDFHRTTEEIDTAVPKPGGPAPKPSNKRRRANKPASYGLAEPIQAGEAAQQPEELGFVAHELIQSLWQALGHSVEGRF